MPPTAPLPELASAEKRRSVVEMMARRYGKTPATELKAANLERLQLQADVQRTLRGDTGLTLKSAAVAVHSSSPAKQPAAAVPESGSNVDTEVPPPATPPVPKTDLLLGLLDHIADLRRQIRTPTKSRHPAVPPPPPKEDTSHSTSSLQTAEVTEPPTAAVVSPPSTAAPPIAPPTVADVDPIPAIPGPGVSGPITSEPAPELPIRVFGRRSLDCRSEELPSGFGPSRYFLDDSVGPPPRRGRLQSSAPRPPNRRRELADVEEDDASISLGESDSEDLDNEDGALDDGEFEEELAAEVGGRRHQTSADAKVVADESVSKDAEEQEVAPIFDEEEREGLQNSQMMLLRWEMSQSQFEESQTQSAFCFEEDERDVAPPVGLCAVTQCTVSTVAVAASSALKRNPSFRQLSESMEGIKKERLDSLKRQNSYSNSSCMSVVYTEDSASGGSLPTVGRRRIVPHAVVDDGTELFQRLSSVPNRSRPKGPKTGSPEGGPPTKRPRS